MDGLFREQALEARRPQALGSIRLATPVSHQVWGVAAAVATIAIVLWLCFGHYTRREHATGRLMPQAGLLTVAARGAGSVSQLNVTAGMHVRAGAELLTISGDQSSVALGDTDVAVADALLEQRKQILASLAGLPEQGYEQEEDLRRRLAMLDIQVRQIGAQLTIQKKEASTSAALLKKIAPLQQRGILSTVQFDQYQANALSEQVGIKVLERQRQDTEQQRSQVVAQLKQLPLATAATQHQLRGQLAQLAVSIAQNEVARATIYRATRAGTVANVLVNPGQAIAAGQPLLSILPKGSPLEAQLLVPSGAIGFVHPGTPVVLHYEAFPYQKFGVQRGTVADVSRSALTPAEITGLLGQQPPPVSLYRVEVKLAAQTIDVYGKPQALLPGMALDADLMLDHRRIIEWMFEPLYGVKRSREGGG